MGTLYQLEEELPWRETKTSYLLWHLLVAFWCWNKFQWSFSSKNKRWLKWLERRGVGVLLGEWKLVQASAFLGSLTRMASALKIKCPTLLTHYLTAVKFKKIYLLDNFCANVLNRGKTPTNGAQRNSDIWALHTDGYLIGGFKIKVQL